MKTTGDLSRAPSWATHYAERRETGAFWFMEPTSGRWTALRDYVEFETPSIRLVRERMTDKKQYFVIELNFSLENE